MATYDEQARNYASNAKQEYLNSLSYLVDDLNKQNQLNQEALSNKYNALYDQINRQQTTVNDTYNTDAQAAYVNKLMAGRALDETLSQMGVNTQGFGANQRLLNETAYGQNLASLQKTRSEGLRDIANQLTDARNQYNVESKELDSSYLAQLLAAKQQQQTMADNYYSEAYNNYLNDLKYQDALKQQQWENDFNNRQLAASLSKSQNNNIGANTKLNNYAKGILSQIEKKYHIGEDKLTTQDISDIHSQLLKSIDSGYMTDNEALYIWSYLGLDENSLNPTSTGTTTESTSTNTDTKKKTGVGNLLSGLWYDTVQHPLSSLLKAFK